MAKLTIKEIPREEWVKTEYIEVTNLTDVFPVYAPGKERSAESALSAGSDWDWLNIEYVLIEKRLSVDATG